ncbi:MAG: Fpg/Nei family DNA glycosylase [Phycicoccus sp.]|nr:Fpg/Nei family DNA glycosylase [Phycicoccus sp.]
MPEGHTLHRLAGALDRAFAGGPVMASSPQGRFVEGAALLDGVEVEQAHAWGKHLFVDFAGERILNVHLGLIGVFDVTPYTGGPAALPPPVGAVRLRLANARFVADLRGATVVDVITPEQADAIVARLGPDPLRVGQPGNDPERSLAKLARTDRPVAELLMDQSVIAGVGNVYRAEVLHRHRVSPFTPGRKVRPKTWLTMWDDLVDLLPLGVAFGQIITLPEQVEAALAYLADPAHTAFAASWRGAAEGERGRGPRRPAYEAVSPFPREYAVYKRTGMPCPTCGSKVQTRLLAGRNLYWCGRCQRRT